MKNLILFQPDSCLEKGMKLKMIEKLKSKIFILIMTSLSIIVVGTIVIFAVLNCTNTITSSRRSIDRLTKMKQGPAFQEERIKPEIQALIDEEKAKVNTHVKTVITFSVLASGLSLIIIYLVSKKVSGVIVKPVYETFEKQKQFISDASHELKTPLAVIEANADVLENEVGNNKWLTYIQNETESMDKLINELLLLAKIENVDDVKSYEKFNLSIQVETSTSMFESMAYEKQVNIVTNIQNDIYINGNKQDIEHIVSTLLDNAIKHSEANKDVKVELSKEKNEIILQVKKRYGLGLAIAKSIAPKYNGKIEVECKDGVTCFKVILQ